MFGSGWSIKYLVFFGCMQLSIVDLFYLYGFLCSEGLLCLGEKWNVFFVFGVVFDLSSKFVCFDLLKFCLGYGVIGVVLDQLGFISE